jgi:hypothetical protein
MKKEVQKVVAPPNFAQYRQDFRALMLKNPNFFGTLAEEKGVKLQSAVFALSQSIIYEELTCVGYNHRNSSLHATIHQKQTNGGYSGSYCNGGSVEYVRFFVDWGNGAGWLDEGLTSVTVHDLPFVEDLCYCVELPIKVKRKNCCDKNPVLPKVRAILSWNVAPPAGNPNFTPVWGNRRDTNIQIAPQTGLICKLDDILSKQGTVLTALQIESLEKYAPPTNLVEKKPKTSFYDLQKIYAKKVEESRFAYPLVAQMMVSGAGLSFPKPVFFPDINLDGVIDFINQSKFNTSYEELTCVGLNRDNNRLHATIQVKREFGYSGNLCSEGSTEYVAFYMDFGAGFEYMGTADIDVHDIVGAAAGLTYDLSIPVNLDKHRPKWCTIDKAKVRAILSWNTPPPTNNPNYTSPWGDWEECFVELQPLPKGAEPGNVSPHLGTLGGMDIEDIVTSGPLIGLATSDSSASLVGAFECAFVGAIKITGRVVNPTGAAIQYRLLFTAPASASQPVLSNQTVRRYGAFSDTILIPDADGWMTYYDDVQDDVLGYYYPGRHGLHTFELEVRDAGFNLYTQTPVPFIVDQNAPDMDITITNGAGDCGEFKVGDSIEGTYRFLDEHAWNLSIQLTPSAVYSVEIDGISVAGLNYEFGTLPENGKSGTWKIKTQKGVTRPCGYNVWLQTRERVIVNSNQVGLNRNMPKGFCLE